MADDLKKRRPSALQAKFNEAFRKRLVAAGGSIVDLPDGGVFVRPPPNLKEARVIRQWSYRDAQGRVIEVQDVAGLELVMPDFS